MRRIAFVFAALALSMLSFAIGTTIRRPRSPAPVPAVAARVPGIVLICVDTLRADGVDADDVSGGLPSVRRWAKQATSFTDAIAPSAWTLPSVASLLTGLHATTHGVVDLSADARLAAAVPTLATTLRDAGFTTAACTGGGWVSPATGLGSGFDRYHVDFDRRPASQAVVRFARECEPDRPFFLFLHTYGAHDPYGDKTPMFTGPCVETDTTLAAALAEAVAARRPIVGELRHRFLRGFLGDPCAHATLLSHLGHAAASNLWLEDCRGWADGGWRREPGGPEVCADLRVAYRRGLSALDARMHDLLEALDAFPPETVVIFTGDHGEAFGEHGPVHHGRYLHREFVHVPLLVRAPNFPAGSTVSAPCSLVDVAPTCLALAGVTRGPPTDGESLVAAAMGAVLDRRVISTVAPGDAVAGGVETRRRRTSVRDATLAWIGTFDLSTRTWVEEVWYDRKDGVESPAPSATPPSPPAAFLADVARARAALEARYRVVLADR
jgi:membrane-anchored protein YejM (alkaline phosphatase superfamily)